MSCLMLESGTEGSVGSGRHGHQNGPWDTCVVMLLPTRLPVAWLHSARLPYSSVGIILPSPGEAEIPKDLLTPGRDTLPLWSSQVT